MIIQLTDKEATLLCSLIEDEQNNSDYEAYWSDDDRRTFAEIVYTLKCGFGT